MGVQDAAPHRIRVWPSCLENFSPMTPHILGQQLLRYGDISAGDVLQVSDFCRFLASSDDVFERHHPPGHFTGSAWLVSADGQRVLLTHHRKLDRWLQLGGHADGDVDLPRVALREAREESGLRNLIGEREIFDLDSHRIPARGEATEHWHYDVRFVVRATDSEAFSLSDESLALAWISIRDLAGDIHADESLRRMARKWLDRGQPGGR